MPRASSTVSGKRTDRENSQRRSRMMQLFELDSYSSEVLPPVANTQFWMATSKSFGLMPGAAKTLACYNGRTGYRGRRDRRFLDGPPGRTLSSMALVGSPRP